MTINPIEQLALQRQIATLFESVRSTIYYGVEPNIKKYLTDYESINSRLTSGDLQAFYPTYLEAIAGVQSSDPAYTEKLETMTAAIADLHIALQGALDKIAEIRDLNPQLLPNPYALNSRNPRFKPPIIAQSLCSDAATIMIEAVAGAVAGSVITAVGLMVERDRKFSKSLFFCLQ